MNEADRILLPREKHDRARLADIKKAIKDLLEEGIWQVPDSWFEEYNELIENGNGKAH